MPDFAALDPGYVCWWLALNMSYRKPVALLAARFARRGLQSMAQPKAMVESRRFGSHLIGETRCPHCGIAAPNLIRLRRLGPTPIGRLL